MKCDIGSQKNISYTTSNGGTVNVSCQKTGKQHSKYWKVHFETNGYSNSINPNWGYMRETTNHIPPNGCLNFHCAVGSNTDNQCSFYCNNGALDNNNNVIDSSKLKEFLIEKG